MPSPSCRPATLSYCARYERAETRPVKAVGGQAGGPPHVDAEIVICELVTKSYSCDDTCRCDLQTVKSCSKFASEGSNLAACAAGGAGHQYGGGGQYKGGGSHGHHGRGRPGRTSQLSNNSQGSICELEEREAGWEAGGLGDITEVSSTGELLVKNTSWLRQISQGIVQGGEEDEERRPHER